MGFLLRPAIALTNRLRYAHKFVLLGLLVLAAIAVLQISLYQALSRVIEPSRQELQGIDTLVQWQRCIQLMQQHRGLSSGVLGGNAPMAPQRATKELELNRALQLLAQSLPTSIRTSRSWHELNAIWSGLTQDGLARPLRQNLADHDQLIARLMALGPDIADATSLTLDPDLHTFYLMQAQIEMPRFLEQLGQTRGYGVAILARKDMDAADKNHIAEIVGRVQIAHEGFQNLLDKVGHYNPDLEPRVKVAARAIQADMQAALAMVRTEVLSGRFGIDAQAYANQLTALIDQGYAMGDTLLMPTLEQRVQTRLAEAESKLRWNVAASAALGLAFAYLIIGTFVSLTQQIQRALRRLQTMVEDSHERAAIVESIAAGDLTHVPREVPGLPQDDRDADSHRRDEAGALWAALGQMHQSQNQLGHGLAKMTQTLREHREAERAQDWFKSGLNAVDTHLRGDRTLEQLASGVLSELVTRVEGAVALLYLLDDTPLVPSRLTLAASYAYAPGQTPRSELKLGTGLAGQAAHNQKTLLLTDLPSHYLPIASALGQTDPVAVVAVPLVHDHKLKGLIEIGSLSGFRPQQIEWLEQAAESIAISIDVLQAHQRVNELLAQTQAQTEELRVQQEQLQQTNEELEERTQLLEQQRATIERKNQEVQAGNLQLARKANELERISTYKSEFLANMSHELRTPLNSMLILSSLLQQNREGHLTPKQVEFAATIHKAGQDLLSLINDILDLSKIEAGRLELHAEEVRVADLVGELTRLFKPMADDRHIAFQAQVAPDTPATLRADGQRLQQILKNLLSNAIKFTPQGRVSLDIDYQRDDTQPAAPPMLRFAVSDTGIGISPDKFEHIFQAFQQADGSTSRQYGGTGLGLSISRQLAWHMGGNIALRSTPGQGSVFTLHLPLDATQAIAAHQSPLADDTSPPPAPLEPAPSSHHALLIVEDPEATGMLVRPLLQAKALDLVQARTAREAQDHLRQARFDCMVLNLDLHDPASGLCGMDLLEQLDQDGLHAAMPIIVHCAPGLSRTDEKRLARHTDSIIIQSEQSADRLLNEVRLFLHDASRRTSPNATQPPPAPPRHAALNKEAVFDQRKVLLVDDDMRNIYALSSALTGKGMRIVEAATGHEALSQLTQHPDVDIVLMDIMMPEMDGFEAMRRIRQQSRYAKLPIIALTAKAMAGDHKACLDAGANDYIAKPIDLDKLLSLMHVWLYQAH